MTVADRRAARPEPPPEAPATAQAASATLSGARIQPRLGLDLATLLGLVAGFAVIAAAMILGGSVRAFVDPPSLLIVFGGTAAVTMISFSLPDLAAARRMVPRTLVAARRSPRRAARQMLLLAEAARKTGIDTLKSLLPELRGEPFLYRGVALITEGLAAEEIERVLTAEAEAEMAGQAKAIAVLRRAAEVAPAMGLIGTLVGLVQMLGHLDDPAAIGPGMALALLTTFYGAVLGNMVLTPLAGKLEAIADSEVLVKNLYLIGSGSIARQENPRRLEMLLNTALPPGSRIRHFDRQPA
ncbi:MAG: flagellar motor protein MotA [Azospirillum sp.]|nr:flagellar motor protein MotA [Azospirillum sp.]